MNFERVDATHRIKSLDVPFYYAHALSSPKIALYNHAPKNEEEMDLEIGETVHERMRPEGKRISDWMRQAVNGRGWDGYFYGSKDQNLNNSDESGYKLYPNYKMRFNMSQL